MELSKKRERQKRCKTIIKKLRELNPHAGMVLNYSNNWELLVAVILSAQCTDKQVNKVTATLFKKYKTLDDYANAPQKDFEEDIYSTGFYRNKAKNIIAAAQKIKGEYSGKIPKTMEEMISIPGVSRKTANVVLGNAHDIVEGIAVDTHVKRLAQRFDLTDHSEPVKIERDLMEVIPQKEWFNITYLLIEYGRNQCPARAQKCPLDYLGKEEAK